MSLPGFITSLKPPFHPSWSDFLTTQNCEMIGQIEKEIKSSGLEFTPFDAFVLRFLQLPVESIRIIILGQDPYPQKGVATGRAFEVGTLGNWSDPYSNVSLKNILRAIYKAYTGEYLKYKEIVMKIPEVFPVLPPTQIFQSWERQGVLLLNTSFSVETGRPGSHSGIWKEFSLRLLHFLSVSNPDIIWFLWGNHAIEICKGITLKNKLVSQHPMMCYEGLSRTNDFLFGQTNHFEKTRHLVDWRGRRQDV